SASWTVIILLGILGAALADQASGSSGTPLFGLVLGPLCGLGAAWVSDLYYRNERRRNNSNPSFKAYSIIAIIAIVTSVGYFAGGAIMIGRLVLLAAGVLLAISFSTAVMYTYFLGVEYQLRPTPSSQVLALKLSDTANSPCQRGLLGW